jgi:putative component of membrane protein insertase Oxa1/YidC/SpoIIIJ protein YidD
VCIANIIQPALNICGQAIEKYGVIKGMWLGIKRICRCNPWSKGGYDPLK